MADPPHDLPPIELPFAQLERALINEYLLANGYDPADLWNWTDPEARRLRAAAATYAAAKLAEVESRAHYIQDMHDGRESR